MFNECSKDLFELLTEQGRVSIMDIHHASYRRLRDLFPAVPSQIVIKAQQDCKAAYQAVKSNGDTIKEPAVKTGLSLRLDQRLCSWKGAAIRITAVGGQRVECGIHLYDRLREMLSTYEVRDPLLFVRDGDIYLTIPFATPEPLHMENHCIGVDLGCRVLAATSEGKAISGKEHCKHMRRIRFLKRQLKSAAMLGSKSAKRRLKRLRRKEARFSYNYTHHVANELLKTEAATLVLEDLAKIKRKRHAGQNKNRVSQIPFFRLKTFLTYKAQALGKRVVTVPARFTSQDDSRGLPRGKRQGRRYYGSDGTVLDAELNAAINIAKRGAKKHPDGNHPVSLVDPLDGSLKPHGQGRVNGPIVGDMVWVSDHPKRVALQAL